jgi:hypothetical protein
VGAPGKATVPPSIDQLRIGEERRLFPTGECRVLALHAQYDVHPDGERFVMLKRVHEAEETEEFSMIQILNFFAELEERGER